MKKLITILGPNASGKSTLAIDLAREFNGEIVSADSRQVYKGLDIGTGKITTNEQALVPHHLLDVVQAGEPFSVADYQRQAFAAIDDIVKRGRHPFLVGGTALYIYAVTDNYQFAAVGPNSKLREELENKTASELQNMLRSVIARESAPSGRPKQSYNRTERDLIENNLNRDDKIASPSARNDIINPDDFRNKRRLIRAIEKLEAGQTLAPKKGPPRYDNLILGIDIPRDKLYARIDKRVDDRVGLGMIEEVVELRQKSPPLPRACPELDSGGGLRGGDRDDKMNIDDWLLNLGLEYRFITEYLQGKWPSREAMLSRLKTAIHAFARRQLTWWRRDRRIHWIKNKKEAARFIKSHL